MFKRRPGVALPSGEVEYGVLEALSRDYLIIVVIDSHSGNYQISRCQPESIKTLEEYLTAGLSFEEIVSRYVNDHVYEEDKISSINCFKLENIRNELKNKEDFSILVRLVVGNDIKYVRVEVRRFEADSDRRFLMSVRDVDREVHMDMLRENEIREAYKVADRASRAKNTFMYNLSHDIRSPLNAIMGYTTVANDNFEDPGMLKKCLSRIDDAGHQVLNIISEILDLNELEEGNITLNEHTLTMEDFEREITQTVQTLIRDRKLDFIVHNKDELNPGLIMDDSHMVRALGNLIKHCSRYTEAGGSISLSIEGVSAHNPEYRRYTFVLEDNGTVGEAENDSGVNIPIAVNILKALGGVLKNESEPGKGHRFEICIEYKVASPADKLSEAEDTSEEDALSTIAGKRVLVVDDSQVSCEIAVTILGSLNAEVEVASDGSTAIDMICSNEVGYYDLILMDIEMPQMDGHETTREIRGLHRPDAKTLPVIALTANVFDKTRQEALASGMNDFIPKPIDITELKEVLVRTLK